jgi:hypothetical protein
MLRSESYSYEVRVASVRAASQLGITRLGLGHQSASPGSTDRELVLRCDVAEFKLWTAIYVYAEWGLRGQDVDIARIWLHDADGRKVGKVKLTCSTPVVSPNRRTLVHISRENGSTMEEQQVHCGVGDI